MPNNIREKARAKCVRVSDIVATKYRNSHGATDSVHLSTLIQSQVAPLVEQLAVALESLYEDSKEFHYAPDDDELRGGAHHSVCGWCEARDALAMLEPEVKP